MRCKKNQKLTPPLRYAFYAVASGSGEFPFDMLRSDRCMPVTEEDTRRMLDRHSSREVMLVSYREERNNLRSWTAERWRSHGWTITPQVEFMRAERHG